MKLWFKLCPHCWEEIRKQAIKCQYCHKFINEKVPSVDKALEGAGYIIAEYISDNAYYRKWIRSFYFKNDKTSEFEVYKSFELNQLKMLMAVHFRQYNVVLLNFLQIFEKRLKNHFVCSLDWYCSSSRL